MGNVLAQLGHAACPTRARCLPLMGRFHAKRLPNKFILQYSDSCFQDSASAYNSCRLNSSHLTIYLSSANHPDNWLTIARQPTIYLSEYYDKKPDNLTVFQKFSFFAKNQRYLHLLLISTNLNPNSSVVRACLDFALLEEWILSGF